jgi:hypothetical protein
MTCSSFKYDGRPPINNLKGLSGTIVDTTPKDNPPRRVKSSKLHVHHFDSLKNNHMLIANQVRKVLLRLLQRVVDNLLVGGFLKSVLGTEARLVPLLQLLLQLYGTIQQNFDDK